MTAKTQQQALDALVRAGQQIETATARYSSGGEAVKAGAARDIAAAMAERATIYRQLPKLYSGRRPARWLAQLASSDAAMAMDYLAEEWRMRAERHQVEAERIERAALPAFADDGMTYVPGRGRVRATSPVTGESNRKRFTSLNGGQR
jgi:hypothetical protein